MAQFPANIDLSSLDGSNGFKLSGEAAGDYSGTSVASAGDVNGDGFADIIVGADLAYANGNIVAGASYVVFGKASGFAADLALSSLDGSNGFKLSGAAPADQSGYSVASAGDVNGDGFADLIIGAINAPNANDDPAGAAYVVFGHASGFGANVDLSSLDGTNGFKLAGEATFDRTGSSVASAGDVNGDGFADLIIGAPQALNANGDLSGVAYMVFGRASGYGATIDLSSLDGTNGFKLAGGATFDDTGSSVASAGDVNHDGFADLIIGAPVAGGTGASYVVFGKATGFVADIDLSSLDGSNGFKISGAAEGDYSGTSVASAGDVNGDGFADLIIGAYAAGPHGVYSGAGYVVFGKASGFGADIVLSGLDGSNGFKISGAAAGDYSGTSVASAGDVNGDGFADLIVGASGAGGTGASYAVFGHAGGFAANVDVSSLDGGNGFKLSGAAAGDYAGTSVASAGDVNGDGVADLIVGADGAPNGEASGASYVIFGRPTHGVANDFNGDGRGDVLFIQPGVNFDSDYQWQMNDRAISGQGGVDLFDKAFSVQVIGDFDGDGKSDVLFENPTTGGVYEWQLDGTTIVSQGAVDVGDTTFHILGTADFTGDGKSDVLWRSDAGFLYEWQMNGKVDTGAPIGGLDASWHVVGAGDFNGDGMADILLRNISGTSDNGAFYLWEMNGANIVGQGGIERPDASWVTLGTGDFNGDGKTDFAVRSTSGADTGAVWVYLMNGTTIASQGAAGIADPATWHVQEIADLNGDGKDDILFRNDAGYFYSWDMNGTHIASEGLAGTEAGNWADPNLHVVGQHWDLV